MGAKADKLDGDKAKPKAEGEAYFFVVEPEAAELRRAIASYGALQAEHSAALRDQWAELLPDLDAGAPPLPPPPAEEAVGV